MSERQIFGFEYQKEFCKSRGLIESNNYTDKFDAKYKDIDCQIKTYKNNGELIMADPFRYINNTKDFILVVANRDDNNNIISERKVFIKNEILKDFFEKQDFENRAMFCKELLNSVSNDYSDNNYFHEQMKIEKEARKKSIINMQAKRDHKSQKRVQWTVPNRHIDTFLKLFEEIEI